MANRYAQIFTLSDIFNNKKLAGKLPLVNYKDTEREGGKSTHRTNTKSVTALVYDIATAVGRGFYSPFKPSKSGNTIILSGELVTSHDNAVDAVYSALQYNKSLLSYTVNNMDIVRSALKEGEKNKRKYGSAPKLFLRAKSMQEIEGMTRRQIQALLANIMENIVYGDDFPETKKKFNAEKIGAHRGMSYLQLSARWKARVGDK